MPTATGASRIGSTAQIADNAVETADIKDENVTLAKIADGTAGTMWAFDSTGEAVAVAAGASGQLLKSYGADTPSWQNGDDYSGTAGSALTVGQPVYVADGSETAALVIQQDSSDTGAYGNLDASTKRLMQSFVVPSGAQFNKITKFYLYIEKIGGPTGNLTLDLYADNGSDRPTGASLGTVNVAYAGIAAGPGLITFTLDTPYTATAGTKYVIVLTPGAGVSGSAYAAIYCSINDQITGTVAYSTNSGSSYTDGTEGGTFGSGDDMRIRVECAPLAGTVYLTDANDATWTHNFIGFVRTTAEAGATVAVQMSGVNTSQSGLTPGATYYLSDTTGAIGSSAGSTSRKIGLALTATTLLIKNDNV